MVSKREGEYAGGYPNSATARLPHFRRCADDGRPAARLSAGMMNSKLLPAVLMCFFGDVAGLTGADTGRFLYVATPDGAQTEGNSTGVNRVLPAMFLATLKDFPQGNATNPHRVVIEPAPN